MAFCILKAFDPICKLTMIMQAARSLPNFFALAREYIKLKGSENFGTKSFRKKVTARTACNPLRLTLFTRLLLGPPNPPCPSMDVITCKVNQNLDGE